MRTQVYRKAIIFMVLLLSAIAVSAQWNLPPDSVHLNADTNTRLQVGQVFTVEVIADVDTPAYGFGFQMQYDSNILKPIERPDADRSTALSVIGDIFSGAQRIRSAASTPVGNLQEVDVVYSLLAPAESVSGEGVLASLAFEVIQAGETRVRLLNPRLIGLNDGIAFDIPLNLGEPSLTINIGGDIIVDTPPSAPFPLLWVLGLLVLILLLLLAGLFMVWQRQKQQAPKAKRPVSTPTGKKARNS